MVYAFGEFVLDDQLYQLRRAGEAVKVEPQVFKLLTYLIVHRDRVVSREELFEQLWPGQVVSEAALTYCMAKARKAVHDDGLRQHVIKTQHGHGYRFVAQVTVHAATHPLVTISLSEDHTLAVRPPLHPSWQSRRLVAVCLLFVFGWMTSLWQLSFRPSSTFVVFPGERHAVSPEVTPTEGKLCRWWVLSTTSHAALDSLLRGWDSYNLRTPEGNSQARQMFQRAIDLDPGYAAAYASLGWSYWREWWSWSQDPHSLEQASLYVRKAVALDSSCPYAHTLLADVYLTQKRYTQAVTETQQAIDLDPTCAHCYASLTTIADVCQATADAQ